MKKQDKPIPPTFTRGELRFFERLNRRGSRLSEYRRFFNITMLIGVTWGLVFLSRVI
jgi:hypothetical protein